MAQSLKKPASDILKELPALPLDAAQWQAVVKVMRLSPQQARIVALVLRGATEAQIAAALHIAKPTIKTQMQRVYLRTGTQGRMQLAMRVLAVSHQISAPTNCHPSGRHPLK